MTTFKAVTVNCRSRATVLSALASVVLAAFAHAQGTTARASLGLVGAEADGGSTFPSLSTDGRYVAFLSGATNLVANDTNGHTDVFVYDRLAGTTVRASVDTSGLEGNGECWIASISGNGRFVVFNSDSANIVPNDINNTGDVFVHDMVTGSTRLLSETVLGPYSANGLSSNPVVTPDGRFVVFCSFANDLVPVDVNGTGDTFILDRLTNQMSIASVDSNGVQGNDNSYEDPGLPAVSADGRFVAFTSYAYNLVPGDNNGQSDVFVRDTLLGITTRVSTDSNGNQATLYARGSAISADGRWVAFGSNAANLVPGDTNNKFDYFVKDRLTGATTRVDVNSSGGQATGGGFGFVPLQQPAISDNGRFVAFGSQFTNLVTGDTNTYFDIFLRDLWLGQTTRVNVSTAGVQADSISTNGALSGDGGTLAFDSYASNLVAGDTLGMTDAFVHRNRFPYVAFCAGDGSSGSTPCPCANFGGTGRGCENSQTTGGAAAFAEGQASVGSDTLTLHALGLPPGNLHVFFQGLAQDSAGMGSVFGDGLRCLAGSQMRLALRLASAEGTSAFGSSVAGDALVSVQGLLPPAGGTRYYQVVYRDGAAYCTPGATNATNAFSIAWTP